MAKKQTEEVSVEETSINTPNIPVVDTPVEDRVSEKVDGIEVFDPLVLRPKELPLVIPTPKGGWANDAQTRYAQILNGYAYKNPEKWNENRVDVNGNEIPNSSKKEVLVKRLADLAKNPGKLGFYMGNSDVKGKVTFKNNALEA